jgi:hypothetical protein
MAAFRRPRQPSVHAGESDGYSQSLQHPYGRLLTWLTAAVISSVQGLCRLTWPDGEMSCRTAPGAAKRVGAADTPHQHYRLSGLDECCHIGADRFGFDAVRSANFHDDGFHVEIPPCGC